MKTKIIAALSAVLFSAITSSAEVAWSVDDNSIGIASGEGSYNLTEAQVLSGLNLEAENSGITLSGEGGISFTGDSPVVSVAGTNVLDVSLASAGSLSIGRELRHYNKDGGYLNSEYFLTTEDKIVFENMILADYVPVSGLTGGDTIPEEKEYKVFHKQRGTDADGEYLICQFQYFDNPFVKCLIIKFRQNGENVMAKITSSCYRSNQSDEYEVDKINGSYLGTDFQEGKVRGASVSTGVDVTGYGIYSITFRYSVGTAYLAMKKDVEVDSLVVEDDVVVVADGGNVHAISSDVLPAMQIDGSLTITNNLSLDFKKDLSGSGELYFGGCQNAVLSMPSETTYETESYLPRSWTTVMYGGVLTSVTNVFVNAFTNSMSGSGSMYHMKTNGSTIVCQMQALQGGYLKCIYLGLQQMSSNIQARMIDSYYSSPSTPIGTDFDTLPVVTGTPSVGERKSYGYGIKSFTLYLDTEASYDPSSLVTASFSGENTMAGGKIYQRGGTANITVKNGLSSKGGVYTVSDAGKLILEVSGCSQGVSVGGGKTELRATGGSSITSKNNCQFDYANQVISLDGSILELASQDGGKYYATYDSGEYVNFITLANGSLISGLYPRVGYGTVSPVWTITGTSPSILDTGLFTYSVENQLTTFDVEDVTGDDEADFIVNGPIQPNGTGDLNMWLRKAGSGTMRLNDRVRSHTPLCLDEGTLELGSSDILCGTHPSVIPTFKTDTVSIQFGGGALAGAASTSNDVGYVSVTNNSQIVLGEGAVFTFADSSTQTWADDMTLSITGAFTKKSVRFGTDATALTPKQQAALRVNGMKAILDSEGYVSYKKGFILILR